ncbi:hypothetical protein ABC977_14390 [Thioalkalicoccus limnaeus]|uniref:Uncharacterized protein n=1 Tax=Thioalkalicoccus limnaeus TaxID=120681 RepID=A0ABV4BGD1_9GAMM
MISRTRSKASTTKRMLRAQMLFFWNPMLRASYRDSASVNKALRLLMEVARNQTANSAQPEHQPERMLPKRR